MRDDAARPTAADRHPARRLLTASLVLIALGIAMGAALGWGLSRLALALLARVDLAS